MGLSENGDDNVSQRFEDLCMDLNMDRKSRSEAWNAFESMTTNYTLEGDSLHWLACALYVACRNTKNKTVGGRSVVEGNCVSLTRLLRSAKLRVRFVFPRARLLHSDRPEAERWKLILIQFFNKMKKWADMASLPADFRQKVERLERNFNVSTVIFKKFKPIFVEIFKNPDMDLPRPPRGRKPRRLPCTSSDLFAFCWTMFVQVKGHYTGISDDLVNSYHLLLACVDWIFVNATLGKREDLLNQGFAGLPPDFARDGARPDPPCIMEMLCRQHEGIVAEAKVIKEHHLKPYLKTLFEKKLLKGKVENLSGVLEVGNFESNNKSINNAYEEYVLTVGDFDERIFLGEDAATEIGTPAKTPPASAHSLLANMHNNIQQHLDQTISLAPSTPLTNRRYLKDKDMPITPVSTATQSVGKLHSLLHGYKTEPSGVLAAIFETECSTSPRLAIVTRVANLGDTFCHHYTQSQTGPHDSHGDFARKRLQLAETLYYKVLESILIDEKRRLNGKKFDFVHLLDRDVFHRSLFACCLEIVLFSYNSQRVFPWIEDVYELQAFNFYKVIETIIRCEDGLSRDVVKHLNHIEETILESLAWKFDSPLWEAMKLSGTGIPQCEEVTFPDQIEKDSSLASPRHPSVKLIKQGDSAHAPSSSVLDRFGSPVNPKRRLFTTSQIGPGGTSKLVTTKQVHVTTPSGSGGEQKIIFQTAIAEDGRQVLIPVQLIPSVSVIKTEEPEKPAKPKRQGSLALFFRKVYHLASVRLRDLCDRLEISPESRAKIWTCFEHCLVQNPDMMMDRHLDQLIMCAIYVMSKVTGNDQQFQEIMRCYRLQPQAESHVYRSVLITSRRRRESGNSSRSASPAQDDKEREEREKDKEKRRADRLMSIRSTSTLPATSHPPTPTRMLGMQNTFETEDRGDLIKFYNAVYVKQVKKFALKFSAQSQEKGECPPLSPLPLVRSLLTSPRKVSNHHSVFISPIKTGQPPLSPTCRLSYCFDKSPAKNLRAINKMLKNGERKTSIKRLLPDDAEDTAAGREPVVKRLCTAVPVLQQKLVGLVAERNQTNGTQ